MEEHAPRNRSSDAAVSFCSFGEKTSTPVKIRKATLQVSKPIPFLSRFLVSMEMTVENLAVRKDVSGKLRLALPPGTSVTKFEFLRAREGDGSLIWFPATAVPKRKTKEVVYREKEKGREVAAASNVSSGSVFEIEVFPLPHAKEVKCRIEFVSDGAVKEFLDLAGSLRGGGAEVDVLMKPGSEDNSTADVAGAAVGYCFGKTHFACRVPAKIQPENDANLAVPNLIQRIAIIWDESFSMMEAGSEDLIASRCSRLRELAAKCNEVLTKRSIGAVAFELYTFGVGPCTQKGCFVDVEELISAIKCIKYDGGTDTTCLLEIFSQLSRRHDESSSGEKIDSALVFTDGNDSFGRVPDFSRTGRPIPFPVHCVADGKEANLRCARAIAAASSFNFGRVYSSKDGSYVNGLLFPEPVIKAIRVDQSEDAFLEEDDDGFCCVPDYRLKSLNSPIGSDGIIITGILGDEGTCQVSRMVVEVAYGSETHEHHFQLRETSSRVPAPLFPPSSDDRNFPSGQVHCHHAAQLSSTETASPESARLLGHLHAESVYQEAENFGLKSGMDMARVREELAVQYGFCSPESSLLMLYTADQFLENDILPPLGHPAFNDPKTVHERNKRSKELRAEKHMNKSIPLGEIGGLKTEEKKEAVVILARDLERYLREPVGSDDTEAKGRRRSRGGLIGSFAQRRRQQAGRGGRSRERGLRSMALAATPSVPQSCSRGLGSSTPVAVAAAGSDELVDSMGLDCYMAGMAHDSGGDECVLECCVTGVSSSNGVEDCKEEEERDFEEVADSEEEEEEEEEIDLEEEATTTAASRVDSSAVAPARNPKEYADRLEEALKLSTPEREWKDVYLHLRSKPGTGNSSSPSFFLSCARQVLMFKDDLEAIKIATNCLEMNIDDVQMLRSVGYFLLSASDARGADLALALFDHVRELQPCEPQSFLDCALVRFRKLWIDSKALRQEGKLQRSEDGNSSLEVFEPDVVKCQELIVHVLTHQWAERFAEVEWPALLLLHHVRELVRDLNVKLARGKEGTLHLQEWPCADLATFTPGDKSGFPLLCPNFDTAVTIWLGWDTDKTDIDLHVKEPSGNEVYYGNRRSSIGGHLSRDFTGGYGPEVYILKKSTPGHFDIFSKYYASHQDSVLTGATSAVLWTIKKTNGRDGKNAKEIEFHNIRLETDKQKTKVASIDL